MGGHGHDARLHRPGEPPPPRLYTPARRPPSASEIPARTAQAALGAGPADRLERQRSHLHDRVVAVAGAAAGTVAQSSTSADRGFNPPHISLPAGASITWRFIDGLHNVRLANGPRLVGTQSRPARPRPSRPYSPHRATTSCSAACTQSACTRSWSPPRRGDSGSAGPQQANGGRKRRRLRPALVALPAARPRSPARRVMELATVVSVLAAAVDAQPPLRPACARGSTMLGRTLRLRRGRCAACRGVGEANDPARPATRRAHRSGDAGDWSSAAGRGDVE